MVAAPVVDAVIPVAVVDSAVEVPAAGCGSSFCCAVAAEMATDSWAADVDAIMAVAAADLTIPACGSFSCCAAAVASVLTAADADVAIPAVVVIPVAASSSFPGCRMI